jgi:superfamily II DNA or RNA helicase
MDLRAEADTVRSTLKQPQNNCAPQAGKKIAAHQAAAAKIAAALVSGPDRGVLLWHSTGSGKTCTAAAMIASVWRTPLRIVYVTNVEASVANNVSKIAECAHAMGLDPWKGRTLAEVHRSFDTRRVQLWTFAKLTHHLQLYRARQAADTDQERAWRAYLSNSFVVMDEAHSLLDASTGQTKEYEALYDYFADVDSPAQAGMKLVLMTATPGDSAADVVKLLNVLRRPGAAKLQWGADVDAKARFCRAARGMVSYFDFSSDRSRFPAVDEVIHTSTMSREQALEVLEKGGPEPGARVFEALVRESKGNNYWKVARAYSNSLFSFPRDLTLEEFSPKIAMLVDVIQRFPDDKHYVYSAFHERRGYGGHGARAIMKVMTDHKGFQDFARGPSAARKSVAVISGSNEVDSVVQAFNEEANDRGANLQVLIATQRYNEGIDLQSVKHVHVFDPLMSHVADVQVRGRAIRMCSHARLRHPDEWRVTIHRYFSKPPDVADELEGHRRRLSRLTAFEEVLSQELEAIKGKGSPATAERKAFLRALKVEVDDAAGTVDEELQECAQLASVPAVDSIVYETVKAEHLETAEFLHVLKEVAIDCSTFREFHESDGGRKINCMYSAVPP